MLRGEILNIYKLKNDDSVSMMTTDAEDKKQMHEFAN